MCACGCHALVTAHELRRRGRMQHVPPPPTHFSSPLHAADALDGRAGPPDAASARDLLVSMSVCPSASLPGCYLCGTLDTQQQKQQPTGIRVPVTGACYICPAPIDQIACCQPAKVGVDCLRAGPGGWTEPTIAAARAPSANHEPALCSAYAPIPNSSGCPLCLCCHCPLPRPRPVLRAATASAARPPSAGVIHRNPPAKAGT